MMGRYRGPGSMSPGAACVVAVVFARTAAAEEPVEVEVRGEAIPPPTQEPSVAGSVIGRERLLAPGLQAGDVLRTEPGIAVLETGGYGAPSTASIRGATAAQTPVYLAGVRLNDDVGGAADLSLVPLWLLHSVEIYRSNAPIAGDELGIGGAIFFEARRPKGREVGAGVMAGSFGAHALWARAGIGDKDASGFVGARLDGARNDYTFVNDSGTRFVPGNSRTVSLTNADARTLDIWAMGSVRLTHEGRADLVINDSERSQGLPGRFLFPSAQARATIQRRLGAITSRVPCAVSRCEVTLVASAIATHAAYDDPLREVALGTPHLDIDATRVEGAILARWSLSDRFSFSPAIRASIERLTVAPARAVAAHAERVFSRAALQGRWAIGDAVALFASGSAECHGTSLDGTPPWSLPGDAIGSVRGNNACGQFEPSGRLGAQIEWAPVTLLANVGRYARVPTLTELYGISGAVRGNTALAPETGVSVEAGLRVTAPARSVFRGASLDLFGFVRTASDLIAYERSSFGDVTPFNVGSARVAGVELLGDYSPAPFVLFALSATLLDPRNTSPVRPVNDVLPYQPKLALVPRVEWHGKFAAHPIDSCKVSVAYFHESSRYADSAGLVVIPEQGSLDVEAEVGVLRDRLALRGRLVNLLDQTRFDLIGYPLPGRAAYIALEAQW